jgi:hypothetical protein
MKSPFVFEKETTRSVVLRKKFWQNATAHAKKSPQKAACSAKAVNMACFSLPA